MVNGECPNGIEGYNWCNHYMDCNTCRCPARANYWTIGEDGGVEKSDWKTYGIVWTGYENCDIEHEV